MPALGLFCPALALSAPHAIVSSSPMEHPDTFGRHRRRWWSCRHRGGPRRCPHGRRYVAADAEHRSSRDRCPAIRPSAGLARATWSKKSTPWVATWLAARDACGIHFRTLNASKRPRGPRHPGPDRTARCTRATRARRWEKPAQSQPLSAGRRRSRHRWRSRRRRRDPDGFALSRARGRAHRRHLPRAA